jgi:hypothetical protein
MDPATGDARLGRPRSRTCTMRRSPDQWAVTRIRSSRPSPACRTLLLTSSETSSWASKASGSGSWSWLRARRALRGAVRVARRRKSRRRRASGAVCWWCLATVTTSLPCLRRQGRGFPPETWPNQRRRIPDRCDLSHRSETIRPLCNTLLAFRSALDPKSSEESNAGMRSETAVRRRTMGAAAIEGGNRQAFPQLKASVVGLAGLEPAASSSGEDPRLRWQTAWYLPRSTRTRPLRGAVNGPGAVLCCPSSSVRGGRRP